MWIECFSHVLLVTLETCSWNSCHLLKPLEMLLKCVAISWNAWNAWHSWNSWCSWNRLKVLPARQSIDEACTRRPFKEFQEHAGCFKSFNSPLETLDTYCYLLKCSWNVLLSLETLESLDTLETQTRLEINRRHHLPDLAVICFAKYKLSTGELWKWQFCAKCHETSDRSLLNLHNT